MVFVTLHFLQLLDNGYIWALKDKTIWKLKELLHSQMKLTSLIRCDSLNPTLYFFCLYDNPGACGRVCGHDVNLRRAYPDDMDGSPRGPDAHTGNICRMRNYRSPDAQLQIAGCATTDHRMRNYRSPDAHAPEPETLPQAPRRSYGKKKNIGNIWGSKWTYDVNFIFWWSVPLNCDSPVLSTHLVLVT